MELAPISLYFGVEKGKRADLETIARASLEWAGLVRDIAAIVAPDVDFEIEFVQSEDGSIWLSNLLKAVKEGDRKALGTIVMAVLIFFAMGPALHVQADFGSMILKMMGHEDNTDLTAESIHKIAEQIVQAMNETQLEERRRNIIAHAERDPDITSIGVDIRPRAEGPITRISREYFASYDELPPAHVEAEEVVPKDVAYERNIDVKIIRANLREGAKRPRWRFRHGEDEWSADIEDSEFVWALNEQKTGLPLAVGQHMRIDLAIDLQKVAEGEWEPKNRRVIRVRDPVVRRAQGELGFGGE